MPPPMTAALPPPVLHPTSRPANRTSVHHLYVVQHPERDGLRERLAGNGIQTAVHYPHALPTMPCYLHWNASAKQTHPRSLRHGRPPFHPHVP